MQLPEPPPPPLAPLWDRVLRARALPPDLDVELLYVAIRDRLTHPEWEVRLHALRVLADLLPLSGNALSFPFDQVVDNLGHSSPNVRKAALDALKVFCTHCEDVECAARAILDKCSYHNIRPHSADLDTKINVITGLILSIPSVMGILKRRNPDLDIFPVFQILGEKLFDHVHRDVAQRSLLKLRRVSGSREYVTQLSRLDPKIQDKFRKLCETYDEDSMDVYYAPRKTYRNSMNNNQPLVKINHVFNNGHTGPIRLSTDSSSESYSSESFGPIPYYNNHFAKVIIETEIKFDSDTAITMTVLEENETESDKNTGSEDDYDSSDRNMLKYSDGDSEDPDVVVKRVRFGGESVKIRTPDSDNLITSEEENVQKRDRNENIDTAPPVNNRISEIKKEAQQEPKPQKLVKKSGIPLPVINTNKDKLQVNSVAKYNGVKLKSKSLSELYDYFRAKNELQEDRVKDMSGLALTLSEARSQSPEKSGRGSRSPVEPHKEVEVLHNLQRSPTVSPRRQQTRVELEHDGFVLSLLASSPPRDNDILLPRTPTPLQPHYQWEDLEVVPRHVADQLHNTENWIAAVRAADQVHGALLEASNVRKLEPAALSFVRHMWALSDEVSAARAPAESAVCALIRSASSDCARQLLPSLISRMAREPLPAALPHALLQRLALHHIVDLIFDPTMIGVSGDKDVLQSAQLRATLCLARAAGPAAVLSAVRRRLAGTVRADIFCNKLRERLSRPLENIKPSHISRCSQLPVPVRRRARSTPPPAAPPAPRRLRPLPDSAPLPGVSLLGRDYIMKPLSPIPLSDRDSSALTGDPVDPFEKKEISLKPDHGDNDDEPKRAPSDSNLAEAIENRSQTPRSVSVRVEDYSDLSNASPQSGRVPNPLPQEAGSRGPSRRSSSGIGDEPSKSRSASGDGDRASPAYIPSQDASPARSSRSTSSSRGEPIDGCPEVTRERDVRVALAECTTPARYEDWEATVRGLEEIEHLAADETARAPATAWRNAARAAAVHARSLRSRVARSACSALGALFEWRGRALDPELEEAAAALLERCADVNRFLRGDAATALVRLARGGAAARVVLALCRRGAAHRAGPVRAAAAAALDALVRRCGAGAALSLPGEARTSLLRAAGELLADATPDARRHARQLCAALEMDSRFRPLLKEAMPPSRYRAIEKYVDVPRYR